MWTVCIGSGMPHYTNGGSGCKCLCHAYIAFMGQAQHKTFWLWKIKWPSGRTTVFIVNNEISLNLMKTYIHLLHNKTHFPLHLGGQTAPRVLCITSVHCPFCNVCVSQSHITSVPLDNLICCAIALCPIHLTCPSL